MTDLILDNTYLILLLPLWIFLIIMCGRFFAVYVKKNILCALTLVSTLLGILLCTAGLKEVITPVEHTFNFIKIANFSISLGIHIDKLSLIIALALFVVSFCVQIFSIYYLKNETKFYRFFALLNIFNFSMAGLLFSPNLFQLYIFWELVGVVSYLLIGFEYKKENKSIAAKRVFLINRIGDTALLAGIVISSYFMLTYAGNISFSSLFVEDFNAISTLLYAYTDKFMYIAICVLFIIGALVKSAQFPFHIWLQDAMEAKLPVSALLHSATMVIAGVFLIIRMQPFFILDNCLVTIIAISGIVTALICSILACIEIHPKKILAYSTSANIGLMFFAIGNHSVKAGLILLIAHALIKSMLFMLLPQENKINPVQAFIFLVGSLTMSGLILTGFISKELIYTIINVKFSLIYCFISFLGAFYFTRLYLLITTQTVFTRHNIWKYIPQLLLLILTIILYIYLRQTVEYNIDKPFYFALAGWIVAYYCKTKNILTKFTKVPTVMIMLYYTILPKLYANFSNLCNKIELNILSNYRPVIALTKFGVKIVNFAEVQIINKFVYGITNFLKKIATMDFILQNGNVQAYNAYAFIWITIIISITIIGYTYILNIIT